MVLQVTEKQARVFDARKMTEGDENAIRKLTGGALNYAPGLSTLLAQQAVLGDYAGLPDLQAAAALLPLWGDTPLAMAMRAAGYAADGQGAVLTPPVLADGYTEVRHYLTVAMNWAQQRYTRYHIWAVLEAGKEELCAQYLACGLSLRGMRCLLPGQMMLVFAACPLPRWEEPVRKVHFSDRRLPRLLEQGYGASDFGWDHQGMVLMLRPVEF